MAAERFTRKKLKQDSFVQWTERSIEFVQRYYIALGSGVLAVIVLLVGFSAYRQHREASHRAASRTLYEAQNAYNEGDYVVALDLFERIVDRYGGSEFAPVARLELAKAQHANGRSQEALATLDGLLDSSDPHVDPVDALTIKATILSDLQRYDEAAAVFEETLEYDLPAYKRREVTDRLVDCYRLAGQPREALRVLEGMRDAVATGEIEGRVQDLDARIAYYRALASI